MAELIARREGAVGWIIFSNPAKFNAMTYDMWQALPQLLADFERDEAVRAIVLAGDGEKAFVSGADISQLEENQATAEARARYASVVEAAYRAPTVCAKPTIAKIRGLCIGGGLGLAAACDLRFASDDAAFRMPAARLGIGHNFVGIRRLVDLIGVASTADIFFSARKFDAAEALRMGFVNRVLRTGELDAEVAAYCKVVTENAPLTIAAAKRAIIEAKLDGSTRDIEGLLKMIEACNTSEDYREGRAAFAARRAPRFAGR